MLSFLIILVGLVLLILVHELGHFAAAKYFGMWVTEFGIGFPPRLTSFLRGETRYSINMLPLGGFVKLHGELEDIGVRSFVNQKAWKRVIVLVAGVVMNFIAGWIIFSAVFWIGVPPLIFIDQVVPNSPAAAAGLQQGDVIIGWTDAGEFIRFITANAGTEVSFEVQREGTTVPVRVTPRANPPVGEGALGVGLRGGGFPPQGLWGGLSKGFVAACGIVWSILTGFYTIIIQPQNVVGPVGIFSIAVNTGKIGWVYVVQLLGVISLNLAVLNLLPIPALDGGRLLLVAIEKLRGKPFSRHIEQRAVAAGFAFLIILIIAVTLKDIAGIW